MRAAIYARRSTEKQSEASIKDQCRICERAALAAGFHVVVCYLDEGISGGTAQRPGYQLLLEGARAGQFDVIIAEDISRLWRNRCEYGSRSTEIEDSGLHLVTCVGDDTRRDGWMVITIKLAIAEQQRREISYRTRRGLEGLALAGKSTGGTVYGYRNGKVDPDQALIIRQIFDQAANGASLARICALLRQSGWSAPRGGDWNRSTVAAILANRRYTGAVILGATESKGGARDSLLKRRVARPEPLVTAHDESLRIIPDPLFDAVNSRCPTPSVGRVLQP